MNKYIKLLLFILAGAILGYGYYYFIGCSSGSCPITSKWYSSTLYGALLGLIAGFPLPSKKKVETVAIKDEVK